MSFSPRRRMLLGFTLAALALVVAAGVVYRQRPAPPPSIHGIFLPEGRELAPFDLVDHTGKEFVNHDLEGRWHVVSYGYTTCPDICPTTLSQLAVVVATLEARGEDLGVLFYTVDYRRDTAARLAAYLSFFDEDFVGLTHLDDPDNAYLPFERGLGIVARLAPEAGSPDGRSDENYQVLHGVKLFLLNPRGRLQAIFEPDETSPGVYTFNPDQLVSDYLAVRRYLES